MRVLVVTAVPAEARAAGAALTRSAQGAVGPYAATVGVAGAGDVTVVTGGVGAAAAAAATGTAIALDRPDLVLSVGIAGSFGEATAATVLIADEIIAADLGAEEPGRFVPLADLGFAGGRFGVPLAGALADRLRAAGVAVAVGPVLTVATVTGTAARARALAARHDPLGEAMEGSGVATAASAHGVPFAEVRAVSNPVAERDHDAWDVRGALATLTRACRALLREPLP